MNIVEEIRSLAIDSSAPEAVDVLQVMEESTPHMDRVGVISAFATALVADGTLTIEDANALVVEASDPRMDEEWDKLANGAESDLDEVEELHYDMAG